MKRLSFLLLLVTLPGLVACRSRVIEVRLTNTSALPVSLISVEYPSASFGVNKLAPGQTVDYRIKPTDTGHLKVQYTDATGAIHDYLGVSLHKNQEGTIDVVLTQHSATANPALR